MPQGGLGTPQERIDREMLSITNLIKKYWGKAGHEKRNAKTPESRKPKPTSSISRTEARVRAHMKANDVTREIATKNIWRDDNPVVPMPLWERYSKEQEPSIHPSPFCRDVMNGDNITNSPHERERIWTEVYINQMCYVAPEDKHMKAEHDLLWEQYEAEVRRITRRPIHDELVDSEITMDELEGAIKDSGINKSPGPDSVTYEMLKALPKEVLTHVLNMFRFAHKETISPKIWHQAIIAPLFKKGDCLDPRNFRPIVQCPAFPNVSKHCVSKRRSRKRFFSLKGNANKWRIRFLSHLFPNAFSLSFVWFFQCFQSQFCEILLFMCVSKRVSCVSKLLFPKRFQAFFHVFFVVCVSKLLFPKFSKHSLCFCVVCVSKLLFPKCSHGISHVWWWLVSSNLCVQNVLKVIEN